MQRAFVNKFLAGLNTDLNKAIVPSENFVEAHNLTLAGDGTFLSLENLNGTTELGTIISSFTGDVLGVYAVKATLDDVQIESLLVFTVVSGGDFVIHLYRLDDNSTTTLYSETYSAAFAAALPAIDA